MKKWLYLIVLGVALLLLAVGGWVVEAFRSVVSPSRRLAPVTAQEA